VNRRDAVFALLALGAAPLAAEAQPAAKVARIGVLEYSTSSESVEAFKQGLRELGYVEGKGFVIE
jgi:hypothetical protein